MKKFCYLGLGAFLFFSPQVWPVDPDDRTIGIWTNYLNSKFSLNGPKQPGWSKERGQTADALVEDDMRREYLKAVKSGDWIRQEVLATRLVRLKPEDPEYRRWLEEAEVRKPGDASRETFGNGAKPLAKLDSRVGRIQLAGGEMTYFWEAKGLAGKAQDEFVLEFQKIRKSRSSWQSLRLETGGMPGNPLARKISVTPVTLDQSAELNRILRQVSPDSPAPDLALLGGPSKETAGRKKLSQLLQAGAGQGMAGTAEEPTYSFSANNMQLQTALAAFGKLKGLNILPDPEITGFLTVNFRDLPLDKAMEAMLSNFGYYAEEDGGLIRVRAMETRRFLVDYPRAKRVGGSTTTGEISLPSTQGSSGSGSADSGDASKVSIAVSDEVDMWKTIVGNVRSLLSEADASEASSLANAVAISSEKTSGVTPGGTIYNSSNPDFKQAELLMARFAKGPRLFSDSVTGVIVVRDRRANLDAIEAYLDDLKKSIARQVDLNVQVYSVEFTDGRQFAIDWNQVAIVAGNTAINAVVPLTTASLPVSLTSLTPLTLTVANSKVNAVIKAIEEQGKARLLTQPRLRTLNHQAAVVKIQRTTPFFIQSADSQQNVSGNVLAVSVEVNNVTTGTLLSITPQISDDGTVAMDVIPVLSAIRDVRSFVGPNPTGGAGTFTNATAPVVDIRQAATLVRVKDGETAVLGGLIEEESVELRKKIPGLGDIPGLGALFTGMADAKVIRELVFFVSPTIVKDLPVAQK
jgi:MSHA type pilus biogenesis protein MshL